MLNQFDKYADVIVLEQEVWITVEKFTKAYYRNLGYDCKVWDTLQININDLPNGSHQKLHTQCPACCLVKQSVCKNIHRYKSTYCVSCTIIKKSAISFAEKAHKVHDNKYDYDLVNYVGSQTQVEILCPEHGTFLQKPNYHLSGGGCPICPSTALKDNSWFIEKSRMVHADRYNYSLSEYKGLHNKLKIICEKHGVFIQNAGAHIYHKTGCPSCSKSKGELEIQNFLNKFAIEFEDQWTNHDAVSAKGRSLRFDFHLPNRGILIEYDGLQHFESVEFFGGKTNLRKIQNRDRIKNKWAKENGYRLIRIPYYEDVEQYLSAEL